MKTKQKMTDISDNYSEYDFEDSHESSKKVIMYL